MRDRRVNLSVYLISRERNSALLYLSTDPILHDRVLPQDCGEPYSHSGRDGAGCLGCSLSHGCVFTQPSETKSQGMAER